MPWEWDIFTHLKYVNLTRSRVSISQPPVMYVSLPWILNSPNFTAIWSMALEDKYTEHMWNSVTFMIYVHNLTYPMTFKVMVLNQLHVVVNICLCLTNTVTYIHKLMQHMTTGPLLCSNYFSSWHPGTHSNRSCLHHLDRCLQNYYYTVYNSLQSHQCRGMYTSRSGGYTLGYSRCSHTLHSRGIHYITYTLSDALQMNIHVHGLTCNMHMYVHVCTYFQTMYSIHIIQYTQ